MRQRRALLQALLVCSVLVSAAPGSAQTSDDEALSVIWREGDTLRGLAETYMGDADLWPQLLRSNGLSSVTELEPGVEIRIPTTLISRGKLALRRALDAVQAANREGARLFAPLAIERAIDLYDRALQARQDGAWEDVVLYAMAAEEFAQDAHRQATASRDAAAEAVVSDREGWVEGRRPEALVWTERDRHDILIEQENVRTLSRSSAQITFRDDSRLRLNANSQAVIQRMRVDPLTRREEATVSLLEGDFYALLSAGTARSDFAVELPEAETDIDSRSFWVRRDISGAKFTNYDDQLLRVSAEGASVALGRNEGTVVRRGEPPSESVEILTRPSLLTPGDDTVAFSADVDLAWEAVEDAAGYWLEIAADPAFDRMTLSRWGLLETRYGVEDLDVGEHYWRIAALDNFGLPGTRSDVWRFHVRVDQSPPYLAIHEPAGGALVRDDPITVRGETDAEATVTLEGAAVPVDEAGGFAVEWRPRAGLNELVVVARDLAGNRSERRRTFRFLPDAAVGIRFDAAIPAREPGVFVTAADAISIAGTGLADALVEARTVAGSVRAKGYSDDQGSFTLNVPLRSARESFELVMTAATGQSIAERFAVVVDTQAPPVVLEPRPPVVTAVEWLPLRGRAEGARHLAVDGRPARLIDGAFDEAITLRDGVNTVELVATDLVGNVHVERFEVVLDQTPPDFIGHTLSATRASAGASIHVEVVARDPSGLKRAAPFALRIGDERVGGFLEYEEASERYRGTVTLPSDVGGRVALDQVEIEDYAGNVTRQTF